MEKKTAQEQIEGYQKNQAAQNDVLSGIIQNSTQTAKPAASTSTAETGEKTLTPMEQYLKNSPIYGKKSKLLEENYNTQKNSINQNKQAALSSASAAHQKMLKYLPEYNAAMGLYGNGASETAYLEADARYRNQQAEIGRNYDSQLAQAESAYNQNQMDLYTEAQAAWEKEQEKKKLEEKEAQQNSFDLAKNTIENWTGDADGLNQYLEGLKGKVSDEMYTVLTNSVTGMTSAIEEEKKLKDEEEKYALDDVGSITTTKKPKSYKDGKNFTIELGDDTYDLQVGESITNSDVSQAAEKAKVVEGQVFRYKGKWYIKGDSGIHKVSGRTLDATDYGKLADVQPVN